MKKISSILLLCLLASGSYAGKNDKWISIGARGTVNTTWMLNNNIMSDKAYKYKFSLGGSGGAMLGFNFNEIVGLRVEALYASVNQKMKFSKDSLSANMTTHLRYMEFPVLLHFTTNNYKYIEVGVKFGSLGKAFADRATEPSSILDYSGFDVKPSYEKSNMAIVFGWGSGIWGSGGLLISTGIRLTYGLPDIISDAGGKGNPYVSASDPTAPPADYKKTNIVTGGFHVIMDFDLGYMMSSSCGRSHKFVLFKH